MKINEKQWKAMKINETQWKVKKSNENLWKSMKNQRKSMKIYENQCKAMKSTGTNTQIVWNLMSALKPSMRFGGMLLTNPSAFEAKDIKKH